MIAHTASSKPPLFTSAPFTAHVNYQKTTQDPHSTAHSTKICESYDAIQNSADRTKLRTRDSRRSRLRDYICRGLFELRESVVEEARRKIIAFCRVARRPESKQNFRFCGPEPGRTLRRRNNDIICNSLTRRSLLPSEKPISQSNHRLRKNNDLLFFCGRN